MKNSRKTNKNIIKLCSRAYKSDVTLRFDEFFSDTKLRKSRKSFIILAEKVRKWQFLNVRFLLLFLSLFHVNWDSIHPSWKKSWNQIEKVIKKINKRNRIRKTKGTKKRETNEEQVSEEEEESNEEEKDENSYKPFYAYLIHTSSRWSNIYILFCLYISLSLQ